MIVTVDQSFCASAFPAGGAANIQVFYSPS
jgi:hypothetical protein